MTCTCGYAQHAADAVVKLTPREREALVYLSKGFSLKQIAGHMEISHYTANDHVKSVYRVLNVDSRTEAAVIAAKAGVV